MTAVSLSTWYLISDKCVVNSDGSTASDPFSPTKGANFICVQYMHWCDGWCTVSTVWCKVSLNGYTVGTSEDGAWLTPFMCLTLSTGMCHVPIKLLTSSHMNQANCSPLVTWANQIACTCSIQTHRSNHPSRMHSSWKSSHGMVLQTTPRCSKWLPYTCTQCVTL